MGEQATGLKHQPADDREYRRPAGIGAVGDQDVTLAHAADVLDVAHHARDAGAAAGRSAETAQACAGLLLDDVQFSARLHIKRGATHQVGRSVLLALVATVEDPPARGNLGACQSARVAFGEDLAQLADGQEVEVLIAVEQAARVHAPAELGVDLLGLIGDAVVVVALVVALHEEFVYVGQERTKHPHFECAERLRANVVQHLACRRFTRRDQALLGLLGRGLIVAQQIGP